LFDVSNCIYIKNSNGLNISKRFFNKQIEQRLRFLRKN
jgi:hypothetical protein